MPANKHQEQLGSSGVMRAALLNRYWRETSSTASRTTCAANYLLIILKVHLYLDPALKVSLPNAGLTPGE